MNEEDRIPIEEMMDHPFIAPELKDFSLNEIDIAAFNNEMDASQRCYSGFSGVNTSSMTSRFGDSEILDTDCVLTTKASD